ncbi:MAG: nuclear transport factor 2 family protein [Anaerolineales bacterium]
MEKATDDQTLLQVMAAEQAWVQAHLDLDLERLEHIMAEDYLAVGLEGELIDKAQTLASYGSGERLWEVAEGDEYTVHLYQNTAIVYGRWRAKGINKGQSFDYTARFISVYVVLDGRWQMVSAQSSPIKQ